MPAKSPLGFGYDTCAFLSGLGLLSGGDLVTGIYSIGGEDKRVPNTLGVAPGISFHGPFEIDQSISRIDSYFGNQANFHLPRFNQLVADANANGGEFGFDAFNAERQRTYKQSRDTNPYFDAGPKQLAVALAERVFIFRALPNGTFEGLADIRNVGPFYLNEVCFSSQLETSTNPDRLSQISGSAAAPAYDLDNVGTDVVTLYSMGPTEVGANEGLNNFVPTGLDFGALTPAEATCFLAQELLDFETRRGFFACWQEFLAIQGFCSGCYSSVFRVKGV